MVVVRRVPSDCGTLVRHFASTGTIVGWTGWAVVMGWTESSSSSADGRTARPKIRARITAITSTAITYASQTKLTESVTYPESPGYMGLHNGRNTAPSSPRSVFCAYIRPLKSGAAPRLQTGRCPWLTV